MPKILFTSLEYRLIAIILASVLSMAPPSLVHAQDRAQMTVLEEPLAGSFQLATESISALDAEFIANHPVLKVAVAGIEFPPFQTINDNMIGGHAIQYLQAMAQANGFKLEYIIYDTWQEVLDALRRREADLTPMAGITDERQEYLRFTSGVTPNPAGLIGNRNDNRFASNQHLQGMRVAVGRGYVAESYLRSQFPESVPVPVQSSTDALRLLESGGADYYYGTLSDVFFEQDQSLIEPLEIKQRVFYSTSWNHIAVRSDWPIVAKLFDRLIRSGRTSIDPLLNDILGERLVMTLPPLNITPDEAVYISQFSSLRVGTVAGVPLLNDIDERGHHVGIASEFTAYIAYQLGLPIKLKSYDNVEQMLEALAADDIDIIPYFAITDEREKNLAFSDPYLFMPWLAVGRGDSTLFWDLNSLKGRIVAMRKKHPLHPLLIERYPEIEVLLTDVAGEAVDAVASGNADATIETKLYVNRILSQYHAGKLRVLGEVKDDPGDFAFAVDPKNAFMVPVLNKALATMDPDFVDRVIRRWVAVDFEPERRLRTYLNVLVPALAVIGLFLIAVIHWNRKIVRENGKRIVAEQRLVDMTEHLRTGVYQFRQYAGEPVKMEFSNKVTREMARVSEDGDDGSRMTFFEHIHLEDKDRVIARLSHCMSTGEHFRESFRFHFPGGENGWILSDAYCRQESDGARVWSGYLFDLTSERMLSEELNAMLVSRDEFFSMASHELRTPVQNLLLALDSIDINDVGTAQKERIHVASSAAKDLDQLVGDVLDLTSMNHHSALLKKTPFELHELVSTVFRSFIASAKKKNLRIECCIEENVPKIVMGDALRVKQVLYNLFGNAVKYTDEGDIKVHVSFMARANSDLEDQYKVVVTDTGIGISEHQLSRVFEPFTTVGDPNRRSSGLGLALCDRLIALMGGHISVASTQGVGSEFTVVLPSQAPAINHSETVSPTTRADNQWNTNSQTIMVVDDNLLVRETLSVLLEKSGWNIVQAENGEAALKLMYDIACLAVVSDHQMPGMTGIELARTIREAVAPNQPRPALILMTGGMERIDAAQASEDFDAVLFKPVKASAVVQTIHDIVHNIDSSDDERTVLGMQNNSQLTV